MIIGLAPSYFYDKILGNPLNVYAQFYVNAQVPFYDDLVMVSSELENTLTKLTQEEKDYFYTPSIKMYTDDLLHIPQTEKYQTVNSFEITKALYGKARYYIKNYPLTSEAKDQAEQFLFANLLNDFM